METYVHNQYIKKQKKNQDNSNYLNDNMLQQVGCVWQHDPRSGKEQCIVAEYIVWLKNGLHVCDYLAGEETPGESA